MSVLVESRLGVRGLEELWAAGTGRAKPTPLTMADRILLDALGLGLGQTYTQLSHHPDLDAFEDWILATAGPPDPVTVARYHAWLDGAPPPEPVRAAIAAVDTADPVLSEDDLAHWDREGWVILRSAIAPEEAAAAAALVWRIAGADPSDPDTWYEGRDQGLMIEHYQAAELDAARRSPRVHKAFAQLWGTADLWTTIDRISFNAPLRPGRNFYSPRLHWDVSLATPIPFATQGILYLTDTAADQGALELVPGFHRRIEAWLGEIGDANPRSVDLSDQAITIAANAGDLVIWRQDLPHGASPNTAALPRLAHYLTMYSPALETHPDWR